MTDLEKLRKEIDAVDQQIAALYEHRMQLSAAIAACKKKTGLPVFQPEREAAVLDKARQNISDAALKDGFADIMCQIMKNSRVFQENRLSEGD